jgi:hypothetical protein
VVSSRLAPSGAPRVASPIVRLSSGASSRRTTISAGRGITHAAGTIATPRPSRTVAMRPGRLPISMPRDMAMKTRRGASGSSTSRGGKARLRQRARRAHRRNSSLRSGRAPQGSTRRPPNGRRNNTPGVGRPHGAPHARRAGVVGFAFRIERRRQGVDHDEHYANRGRRARISRRSEMSESSSLESKT